MQYCTILYIANVTLRNPVELAEYDRLTVYIVTLVLASIQYSMKSRATKKKKIQPGWKPYTYSKHLKDSSIMQTTCILLG